MVPKIPCQRHLFYSMLVGSTHRVVAPCFPIPAHPLLLSFTHQVTRASTTSPLLSDSSYTYLPSHMSTPLQTASLLALNLPSAIHVHALAEDTLPNSCLWTLCFLLPRDAQGDAMDWFLMGTSVVALVWCSMQAYRVSLSAPTTQRSNCVEKLQWTSTCQTKARNALDGEHRNTRTEAESFHCSAAHSMSSYNNPKITMLESASTGCLVECAQGWL